jgi:hypothetical protein
VLAGRQAQRDREVLAGLAHPARTWGFADPLPPGPAQLAHRIEVPAATARLKVVAHVPSTTPLGNPMAWEISVTDGAGRPVGAPTATAPGSGTAVLDLDLRWLDPDPQAAARRQAELAWGTWTLTLRNPVVLERPTGGHDADRMVPRETVTAEAAVFN